MNSHTITYARTHVNPDTYSGTSPTKAKLCVLQDVAMCMAKANEMAVESIAPYLFRYYHEANSIGLLADFAIGGGIAVASLPCV